MVYSPSASSVADTLEQDCAPPHEATADVGYEWRARIYGLEFPDAPDLPFVAALLRPASATVLEVPCGCGRLTLPLAEFAAEITAVDIEARMIAQLEARLDRSTRSKIRTHVGDMRTLRLAKTFDWVICQREAFQLLPTRADAIQALETFRRHLGPSGRVMIDIATFNRESADTIGPPEYFVPEAEDGSVVYDWRRTADDGSCVTRSHRQWLTDDLLEIRYTYVIESPGKPQAEFSSPMSLRRYAPREIQQMLSEAGLTVVESYGGYDHRPFDGTASRLILIAQAAGASICPTRA